MRMGRGWVSARLEGSREEERDTHDGIELPVRKAEGVREADQLGQELARQLVEREAQLLERRVGDRAPELGERRRCGRCEDAKFEERRERAGDAMEEELCESGGQRISLRFHPKKRVTTEETHKCDHLLQHLTLRRADALLEHAALLQQRLAHPRRNERLDRRRAHLDAFPAELAKLAARVELRGEARDAECGAEREEALQEGEVEPAGD